MRRSCRGYIDSTPPTSPRITTTIGKRPFYEGTLALGSGAIVSRRGQCASHAARGVTTARDVGSSDFIDVALRNAINGAGLAEGPRMLVVGHAIGSTGGHCDSPPVPPDRMKPSGTLEGVCNGPESCRQAAWNR